MDNVKSTPPLIESRVKDSSYARNIWCATPELGTTVEDLLDQKYWAHMAYKLRPTDRIEATAEDGSYFAELMVQDAGKLWAKVALMRKVEFARHEVGAEESEFEAKFIPGRKWRVTRKSDRAVMIEELSSKEDCLAWIVNHQKAAA